MFVNFIVNFLMYGEGSPLTIDASTGAEAVHLRIADSGPGVSDEALETIFTPFTRLDESNAKGLGLGMAVALGLCRAMGIELSAEHTPGGGFTAVLTFPTCTGATVQESETPESGALEAEESEPEAPESEAPESDMSAGVSEEAR